MFITWEQGRRARVIAAELKKLSFPPTVIGKPETTFEPEQRFCSVCQRRPTHWIVGYGTRSVQFVCPTFDPPSWGDRDPDGSIWESKDEILPTFTFGGELELRPWRQRVCRGCMTKEERAERAKLAGVIV